MMMQIFAPVSSTALLDHKKNSKRKERKKDEQNCKTRGTENEVFP